MNHHSNNTPTATPRLIRMPEVQRLTGLGRSTIYAMIAAGTFPRQRKVTPTKAVWVEAEVLQWITRVVEETADMHSGPTTTSQAA